MKIITVLGARPQFIKAAMGSKNLIAEDSISEVIIHTGQHFDQNMSDIFFIEMGLPKPDYNLNINQMSHGQMTAKMMEKIEPILMDEVKFYFLNIQSLLWASLSFHPMI